MDGHLNANPKFVQVEVDVPLQNWFNSALVNLWLCGPQNISQSSGNRCSSVLVQVSLGSSVLVQVSLDSSVLVQVSLGSSVLVQVSLGSSVLVQVSLDSSALVQVSCELNENIYHLGSCN